MTKPVNITHAELCMAVAKRYNKKIALYEYKSTASVEEPDVLIFDFGQSYLFEIKVSLVDFRKDQNGKFYQQKPSGKFRSNLITENNLVVHALRRYASGDSTGILVNKYGDQEAQ